MAVSTPTIKMDLKKLNYSLVDTYLPTSLILDFDSTVETVYGNQEKAAVGVNPFKRGRKSYHPILVYEGQSRFCLNAELRPGNVIPLEVSSTLLRKPWGCFHPIKKSNMFASTRVSEEKTSIPFGKANKSVMSVNSNARKASRRGIEMPLLETICG